MTVDITVLPAMLHTGLYVPPRADAPQITSPGEAHRLYATLYPDNLDRELCLVASLCNKHRLIAVDLVSLGSVDHTFMAPRDVYRAALMRGAAAIFVAHNHPSGDAEPSADDRAITRRLAQAGGMLGVDLLDHIVLGTEGRWTSMAVLGVI